MSKAKNLELHLKIETLVQNITIAFQGIALGQGISWREADVIDDYGSIEDRKKARALDEQKDWTKIPLTLIGANQYNAVLCFMNSEGVRFYLAPIMIYALKHYKTNDSLITDSLSYTLQRSHNLKELKPLLTPAQIEVIIQYLEFCMTEVPDYFDTIYNEEIIERLKK